MCVQLVHASPLIRTGEPGWDGLHRVAKPKAFIHQVRIIARGHEHGLRGDFGGSKQGWAKECQHMAAKEGRHVLRPCWPRADHLVRLPGRARSPEKGMSAPLGL